MTGTPEQQGQLAKVTAKKELRDFLQGEAVQRQLAMALPRTMSPERFVRIALTSIYRNPELLKCSQDSFLNVLLQLSAMGIEPDGRRAHLIPFGGEVTLIVDYKGIAEVLRRNHDVSTIHCDVVYSRDEYEAEQGTNQHLRHIKAYGNRGERILAYSFVRLPDGSQEFEEMTIDEIERVRSRSRAGNKGPWISDYDEMCKKTVFRRHSKLLPLSPETREVLDRELDGDALADEHRIPAARIPVANATVLAPAPRRGPGRPRKAEQEPAEQFSDVQLPAEPESAPEPPPEQPEPPSKKLSDTARLIEDLLSTVTDAGYTPEELYAVLRSKRIMKGKDALEDIAPHHLQMCIDQWSNLAILLAEERKKHPQPKAEQLL